MKQEFSVYVKSKIDSGMQWQEQQLIEPSALITVLMQNDELVSCFEF